VSGLRAHHVVVALVAVVVALALLANYHLW
jgi:hypothetical protein